MHHHTQFDSLHSAFEKLSLHVLQLRWCHYSLRAYLRGLSYLFSFPFTGEDVSWVLTGSANDSRPADPLWGFSAAGWKLRQDVILATVHFFSELGSSVSRQTANRARIQVLILLMPAKQCVIKQVTFWLFMKCYVYLAMSLQYLNIQEVSFNITCPPPTFYFLPRRMDNLKHSPDEERAAP